MKSTYLVAGAVIIAAASFGAGYFYRAWNSGEGFAGTLVAKDAGSITVRLPDDSVRSVNVTQDTHVFGQPPSVPMQLSGVAVGSSVTVVVGPDGARILQVSIPAK